jgi:ParB family transcriptional regulator, chromosome partitioning protein
MKMSQITTEISIDRIDPNPFQPRTRFPEKAQHELMESIRRNGLIQPIVVRQKGERYQLLAGERRFRAVQDIGLPTITAHVRDLSDEEMRTLSILENVQREDLNPIDLAKSYKVLVDDLGYSQEKIAHQISRDRSTIANCMRLLELPDKIQIDLSNYKISAGHARALLALKDSPKIYSLRDKIIENHWSVRETERKVKLALQGSGQKKSTTTTIKAKDPNVKALEEQLAEHLETHVEIWGETEGSIQISFASVREFNRIFNLILEREREEEDDDE